MEMPVLQHLKYWLNEDKSTKDYHNGIIVEVKPRAFGFPQISILITLKFPRHNTKEKRN